MGTRVTLFGVAKIIFSNSTIPFLPEKRFLLLAFLAFKADWVSRDQLALLLWDDADSVSARKNLRHLLSRVRDLPFVTLETLDEQVRWVVDSDVLEFARFFATGDWKNAVASYQGLLLEGLSSALPAFEEWLEIEQETLRTSYREAVLSYAAMLESKQQMLEMNTLFQRALRFEPLAEDVLQAFLRLSLQNSASQVAALQAYEAFAKVLDQEMGLVPLESTTLLAEQLRNALITLNLEPVNILRGFTAPNTAFIGRERELQAIEAKLSAPEVRLLTLVGQGGIGKTRLAIETASRIGALFAQGSTFVALANLSSTVQVLPAIFAALELPLVNAEHATEQLITHLQNQEMLLIFDNFEHLLDGADILLEILQSCPAIKILTTSREVLDWQDEYLLDIFGMSIPASSVTPEVTPIEEFDAVQLFLRSAKKTNARFTLEPEDQKYMIQICQLLNGLPLALELASHWTRVLTLAEIVLELELGLTFLQTTQPELPERHRSLRAVFEYAWTLLNPDEQMALQRLAVFQNGFTREAAEHISGITIRTLLTLCNKSFLQRNATGRFERHLMVQEFSFEKLHSNPALLEAQQEKHSDYYFDFLEQRPMGGSTDQQYLTEIETDLENIRTAWHWAVHQKNYLHLERSTDLVVFFDRKARCEEGQQLFEDAIEVLEQAGANAKAALGKACFEAAWLGHRIGRYDIALAERAVQLLQSLEGRETWLMKALSTLSALEKIQGYPESSLTHLEVALKIARMVGNSAHIANYLVGIASLKTILGRYSDAENNDLEALLLHQQADNSFGITILHNELGILKTKQGFFPQAKEYLNLGLQLAHELKYTLIVPFFLNNLGEIALKTKQYEVARSHSLEALQLNELHFNATVKATSLIILGRISESESEALLFFQDALRIAWKLKEIPLVIKIFLGVGEMYFRINNTQAQELFELVYWHPATEASIRFEAQQYLEQPQNLAFDIEIFMTTRVSKILSSSV